ncbi:MAG: cobalamin-binding protein [Natronospirillum sp.]|uniref:cobalamin-binding protein n=1 Tax=Natronospirillum sp. TaxID=2812955 RepID=UPI0025E6A791|nr:cobalamin-binding protein [Natronospirillum sp.]MCH8551243.1 cobalamin-binding protein [Natronospirillum sp.]
MTTLHYPQRIICMTEEPTETLYLLEEDWRIVGISGFTVRPARARKEKPKVSAFISAKIDRILELQPDLAIGFSDMQADIAAELIRQGIEVHIFNHRSVEEIYRMIGTVGGLVGCQQKAEALIDELRAGVESVRARAEQLPRRPRVYFEEWDDPMLSGIRWVSELVEIAGGEDCFPELRDKGLGKDRIIADPETVIERQPDIIIGSWCGKKFRPEKLAARPGFERIPAVRTGDLYEVKSVDILQPGPAALTDGLRQLHQIIADWANRQPG